MRKGFLMYEEMRTYLTIYEEATPSELLIYEENFFFFLSVQRLERRLIFVHQYNKANEIYRSS